MSLVLRVATDNDTETLLKFLREFYYPEEPLTLALQPYQQADEDEEFSLSNIQYGTCIIAEELYDNNTVNIIGGLIAGPKYPNEAEHLIELSDNVKSEKWSKMLKLLSHLEYESNVFKRYNVKKVIHCHSLAVNKYSRGKSIGIQLVQKLMEIGKILDYTILTFDCTSIYSIRLCEKLKMNCINIFSYDNYLDEYGNMVFRPPMPHNLIKTFAISI